MTKGLVNRIIRFSLVDGPGSRMAVFLQGCNMQCLYCHNPETQRVCSQCGQCLPACRHAALCLVADCIVHDPSRCRECDACLEACLQGSSPKCQWIEAKEIVRLVRESAPLLDGLTISGGECTLQPDFVVELCEQVHQLPRMTILLDTNGHMPPVVRDRLSTAADGFIIDIKAMDAQVHERLTGMDNALILDNIRRLHRAGKVHEIRTVVVPGYTDNASEIEAIAKWVAGLHDRVSLRLIRFRPYGVKTSLANVRAAELDMFRHLGNLARHILGPRLTLTE